MISLFLVKRKNSLENTFRKRHAKERKKKNKKPSSFFHEEILLSEFFKLRPNVFHWDRGKHAGLVFPLRSPRVRPVPLSLPFQCPPRLELGSSGGGSSSCLSHEETFFKVPFRANDHQGLFLSLMRNAARVENPAGRLFFSLATLLPSRLSTLHLSLPLYPSCPFYQQGRILQIWNTFPRETFASRFYPHDFVAIFTFVLEPTEDRVSGVGV